MILLDDCEFLQWRSIDDEAAFFAHMGRFFASAAVRRECGGYPLSDSPRHRWFVARHRADARVLGFISIELQPDLVRLRDVYVRSEARGRRLFHTLLQQVLDYVDRLGLDCMTRLPDSGAACLVRRGFHVQSTRGAWVTLMRKRYVAHSGIDGTGGGVVPRTGRPAAERADRCRQPDTPAIA